jgi:hypothetical protein
VTDGCILQHHDDHDCIGPKANKTFSVGRSFRCVLILARLKALAAGFIIISTLILSHPRLPKDTMRGSAVAYLGALSPKQFATNKSSREGFIIICSSMPLHPPFA